MPDAMHNKKSFAVVSFLKENSIEVIPSSWIVSPTTAKWPITESTATIQKYIRLCQPHEASWDVFEINIYTYSNSFKKARKSADALQYTSNLSSDSSAGEEITAPRKKVKPSRYRSSPEMEEESESLLARQYPKPQRLFRTIERDEGSSESEFLLSKEYPLPDLPGSSGNGRTLTHKKFKSSLILEKEKQLVSKDHLPINVEASRNTPDLPGTSQRRNDSMQVAPMESTLTHQYLEKLIQMHRRLTAKVDELTQTVQKLVISGGEKLEIFQELPSNVQLPVSSDEALYELNKQLKNDKEMSATLVRYLNNVGSGKAPSSFVLSLTKRIVPAEVAVLYSRYGRKGKKSFAFFHHETLNVILAAAALKFPDIDRDTLGDLFGKALSSSSDWNGRRSRPSDSKS